MRKSLLTRGLAVGLVCSMAFLCACGKKKNTEVENAPAATAEIDREHVYTMEDLSLPFEGDYYVRSSSHVKDSVFSLISSYSGQDNGEKLYKIDLASGEFSEIELEKIDYGNYIAMECDGKGNIYLAKEVYGSDEEDLSGDEEDAEGVDGDASEDKEASEGAAEGDASEDKETSEDAAEGDEAVDEKIDDYSGFDGDLLASARGISVSSSVEVGAESVGDTEFVDDTEVESADDESADDEEDYDEEEESTYTLVKMTESGEKVWEMPLTEEDSENYVQGMVYVDGKGILTNCNGHFSLYDENTGEGKSLFSRNSGGEDDYYYASLYRMNSGDVYLSEEDWSDNGKNSIEKFNKDKLDFEGEIELPEGVYGGSSLCPGTGYDFYTSSNSEIKAFNIGDDKTELICDLTASDLLVDYLSLATDTSDGKLFIIADSSDGGNEINLLSKVDPSEVVEKETLTIGTIFIPDDIRKQVVKFNKKSDKYRIKIIDYAPEDVGDNADGYMEAANQLSLALTQGQGPDMLVVNYSMPVASYAEKGVFEPLDPYFESDNEIKVTDFLENVIEAGKVGDKIYSIIPSFVVETCFAAKDKLGDDKVTLENYKTICEKNGIDTQLGMGILTASDEQQLYATIGLQFIDYENGTCSFDTPGFIDLLNFIKELPKDMESAGLSYEDYETYYRENKSLLLEYYLSSFNDYQVVKKGYFGTDVVFNGFPSVDCGESFLTPQIQVAMSSDCKNKDAAWEFMRSYLLDDYQKAIEWSFPAKITALEAMEAKAQEKPYYIDENGKKVEEDSYWGIGGTEVKMTELSKEETTQVMDFIKSVTKTDIYEEKILNIISEEAAAFYEGQKTAEEAADIIQSRVSLYMSENM